MKQCSPVCNKILGGIRIIFGLWMLWAGLSKLFAVTPKMITDVGTAGHLLGLTFLSVTAWFWIAVVGEIIAGLFLVSGCCKLTKIGVGLTVVIMIFALNSFGWTTQDTILAGVFFVIASSILVWGRGARCFCKCAAGKTCTDGSCCAGGSCEAPSMRAGVQQMKAGAATVGAGAVAEAKEMIGKAKNVAGDMLEKADDLVEKAKDIVENAGDVVKKVGGEAGTKVVDVAKTALDKADAVIEDAKEVVDNVEEKIEEKTA